VEEVVARTNLAAITGHRPRLRRVLDMWGFVPGFGVEHRPVSLHARDGTRLSATYLPGPDPCGPAVVLVPGFAAHRRKPAYGYLAEQLTGVSSVLAIDLRGHGGSGGSCSLGDQETLDVRAAAGWLRRRGHGWVGVIGSSMGGSAALRAAGTGPPGVFDAVCAISAPAVWGLNDTATMQALTRLVSNPVWRGLARPLLRVRIAGRWSEPAQPVDVVGAVSPTPALFVHGVDDHYYDAVQAQLLFAAAGEPKALWVEPAGFGHAEDGITPAFVRRLVAALETVHRTGRWPESVRPDPVRDAAAR
jgi:uncharacterized protein